MDTPEKTFEDKAKTYIARGGAGCLYCGSDALVGGPLDADGQIRQEIACLKCDKSWTDVYVLTHVEE